MKRFLHDPRDEIDVNLQLFDISYNYIISNAKIIHTIVGSITKTHSPKFISNYWQHGSSTDPKFMFSMLRGTFTLNS